MCDVFNMSMIVFCTQVTHKYTRTGFYTLAVNALDPILSATGSLTFPVSADPCGPPSITITNGTSVFNAASQQMRQNVIIVEGVVNLMCSLTIVNGKQWTIEKVHQLIINQIGLRKNSY
jgi:hypothetical protein